MHENEEGHFNSGKRFSLYTTVCVDTIEEIVEPGEEISFCDQIDFVKSFCYLGDKSNASGRSEAAVTART